MNEPAPAEGLRLSPVFWALAALLFAATIWAVWDELVTRRPWIGLQREFAALLARRGEAPAPAGVRQVTNPDLGIADRCQTCHLGIDRRGLEGDDVPPVFRTHPRRADLVAAHPIERFGCTSCHDGQGLQTKGVGRAAFDHGRDDPYWERPLLGGPFVEASCGGCHASEREIAGAPVYERGRWLFEHHRCGGCHVASGAAMERAPAPPLDRIRAKMSQATVEAWLKDPRALRADARMGSFWAPPVEPVDGAPPAPGSERHRRWAEERAADIPAIVAFLGAVGTVALPDGVVGVREPSARPGLAEEGKALFDSVGCRGCHAVGEEAVSPELPRAARFGPALDGVGERVSSRWLAAWLGGPRRFFPEARMPDMRLEARELDALVAYLVSLRADGRPPANVAWSAASPELAAKGRAAVLERGCTGCHGIPGLDRGAPIGPDLDAFGEHTPDSLDWGEARIACDRPALECWTLAKLEAPRRLEGRGARLAMPHFDLSAEDRLALAVFLLGQRPRPGERTLDDDGRALAEGERIIARRNCRGCHEIGRDEERVFEDDGSLLDVVYHPRGGEIQRLYEEPALAPPPLTFAGSKFQPQWAFGFLREPTRLRPWLAVRMPRFDLDVAEATAIVRYFAVRERQPWPFAPPTLPPLAPAEIAEGERLFFGKLQCLKCHRLSVQPGVKMGERAPDLALSPVRLKPGWLAEWLLDPQRLQPGTRMPTYFPLADDDDPSSRITPFPAALGGDVQRQIDALVHVNMRFGRERSASHPASGGATR